MKLAVLGASDKPVLADFSPSGFRFMNTMHRAEGRRYPHPGSRFAHWRTRLQSQGFRVNRFCAHRQEVLVASPSAPSP